MPVPLALIALAAFCALKQSRRPLGRWAAVVLALVFSTHSLIYLWTKKFDQYVRRAEPTEMFLRFAAGSDTTPIRVICAPYGFEAFRYAAIIRLRAQPDFVLDPGEPSPHALSRTFCDLSTP